MILNWKISKLQQNVISLFGSYIGSKIDNGEIYTQVQVNYMMCLQ